VAPEIDAAIDHVADGGAVRSAESVTGPAALTAHLPATV
jgi:hypothetical protein